jgi:hypothetical protein
MATITYSDHQLTRRSKALDSELDHLLHIASIGHSFQTREVLHQIIVGEQQRIKEEQMLWRVGGSLLGLCFGLSDGFQLTDLFIGMSGGAIGSLAYDTMSQEDRKFLEQCQSLWLMGCNSPMELQQRLGPARARIVIEDSTTGEIMICNHHQGHRGDYLVPLGAAGAVAAGFQNPESLAVLSRHLSPENIEILQSQFYPVGHASIQIDRPLPISREELRRICVPIKESCSDSRHVVIRNANGSTVAYHVPIPSHSDF